MKKIKLVLSFVFCLCVASMAVAQTSVADYVKSLDKRVTLTEAQKTSVTDLYTKLVSDIADMTDAASIKAAKTTYKSDLNALLTGAQRAKLNTQIAPR